MTDALASENEQIFDEGDEAAQVLSIDTWKLHFSRVRANPLTSSSWYRFMQQTNESRINEVLAFAESVLPFDRIETGPGDELGLGSEFQPHQALDWVLQDLRRFPGHGWRMIKAGLRQWFAIATWRLTLFPNGIRSLGERKCEPKSRVR